MVIPSSPSGRARGGWSVLGVPSEVVHLRTSFFVPEVMPEGYENVLKPFSSHPCKWEWVQVENKAHPGSNCGAVSCSALFFLMLKAMQKGEKKHRNVLRSVVLTPPVLSQDRSLLQSTHLTQVVLPLVCISFREKKNKGKKESIRACCNASKMNFLYV